MTLNKTTTTHNRNRKVAGNPIWRITETKYYSVMRSERSAAEEHFRELEASGVIDGWQTTNGSITSDYKTFKITYPSK